MSDKEYFAVDAMSASILKAGAVSMLYMQHRMETPMVASPAMVKGSLMHMATLEPDRFLAVEEVEQGKRSARLDIEHGPLGYVPAGKKNGFAKAAQAVKTHPEVVRLGLFNEGEPEAEIYWDEDGKPCKCKVDWLGGDYWVEFKTTQQIGKFANSAAAMSYHLQLGWYHRGVATLGKPRKCYVVVQEQSAPYDVAVLTVSSLHCKRWFNSAMSIYDRWLSDDRSGAYSEAYAFELPVWAEESTPLDVEVQMDSMFNAKEV